MDLILASNSPRRRELFATLGFPFRIETAHTEEYSALTRPDLVACDIALAKARAVADGNRGSVVIGADTSVWIDGEMLGKPRSREEAIAMLRRLSGRTHSVITGVAAVCDRVERVDACETRVTFGDWTDGEIAAYVDTGSPFDKAGGYGIQELPERLARAEGGIDNVIGLPIGLTGELIRILAKEADL